MPPRRPWHEPKGLCVSCAQPYWQEWPGKLCFRCVALPSTCCDCAHPIRRLGDPSSELGEDFIATPSRTDGRALCSPCFLGEFTKLIPATERAP